MMVNFMHQLDWAMAAQIAVQASYLGVRVRVFLEEVSI